MKLTKIQAQAIISKLGREYNNQRTRLIEDEKKNYTLSPDAIRLAALIAERDRLKEKSDAAINAAKKCADELGITCFYTSTKADEALNKLRDKEIEAKYTKVDLDAALDDLIIESVEDDFSVDGFIEQYLKQMKNG